MGRNTSPADPDISGASRQKGRGRGARSPAAIPLRGWKDIAIRVVQSIGRDRVMLIAAGVSFLSLLAFVPTLSAVVAIYGLFADQSTVLEHVALLEGIVPGGGLDIIREQLQRLTQEGRSALGWTLGISLAIALWSSSAGIKAMFEAMNVAYDEEETRGFIKISLLGLLFALSAAIAAAVALGTLVFIPAMVSILPLGSGLSWLIRILSYLVLFGVILIGLAALYRWGPDRAAARWRWVTPGALIALIAILFFSILFSWYVTNFGNYGATYGSLGAIIAFMSWMWISLILVILGAEINSEVERQTMRDSTTGPEQPMGTRGAYVADTVG